MLIEAVHSALRRRGQMIGHIVLSLAYGATLASCAGPQPPARPVAAPPTPIVLPPAPWRDGGELLVQRGTWQWNDARRERAIRARWAAPGDAPAQGLILVLPGLARGVEAPAILMDSLAGAGFAVVSLGHPGNDDSVWQSPAARHADFKLAARRMYSVAELTERGDDVRFVLDAIEREAPSWLRLAPSHRTGLIGIDLGAQTAQWLVGEQMARELTSVASPRLSAAALLGPYVGFDGPSLHQRYQGISVPLLVVFGAGETDPYGLGMTAAQRRAMVGAMTNARVTEIRTPASVVSLLYPSSAGITSPDEAAARMPGKSGAGGMPPPGSRSGRGGSGGAPPAGETGEGGPPGTGMPGVGLSSPSSASSERLSTIAIMLSLRAFFEAELLGNADAREWLEGRHPGPVQWATYAAGRSGVAPVATPAKP
jgi:hypothetical protein